MAVLSQPTRVGSVIGGRYRVLAVLGRGGMGVLYTAEHVLTQRRVALKLLKSEADSDPVELAQLRRRFLVEARTASAVRHPNIVDVLDMGSDDEGAPFLALELLEGIALDRLLSEKRRLTPEQTLSYLLPIIGALATLHDAGIIHRDIKPSNIFLRDAARNTLEPKLLDFGLAHTLSDMRLTRSGLAMGTPLYMAPEQARGDSVGPAADVWSMGVVLYECLAGCMPFQDRSPATYAAPGLASRIRPLSEAAPQLPSPLAYAVERALRRDLPQRYRCMRELAQSLVVSAQTCDIKVPSDPDPVGLPDLQAWRSSNAAANTVSAAVVARNGRESGAEAQNLAPTPASPTSHRGGAARSRSLAIGVSALLITLSLALGYGWLVQDRTAPVPAAVPRSDTPRAPEAALRPAEPTAMPIANGQNATTPASGEPSTELVRDAAVSASAPARNDAASPRPIRRAKSKVAPSPREPAAEAPAVPNPFHVESDWR